MLAELKVRRVIQALTGETQFDVAVEVGRTSDRFPMEAYTVEVGGGDFVVSTVARWARSKVEEKDGYITTKFYLNWSVLQELYEAIR